jgi:hypothetical protein
LAQAGRRRPEAGPSSSAPITSSWSVVVPSALRACWGSDEPAERAQQPAWKAGPAWYRSSVVPITRRRGLAPWQRQTASLL